MDKLFENQKSLSLIHNTFSLKPEMCTRIKISILSQVPKYIKYVCNMTYIKLETRLDFQGSKRAQNTDVGKGKTTKYPFNSLVLRFRNY